MAKFVNIKVNIAANADASTFQRYYMRFVRLINIKGIYKVLKEQEYFKSKSQLRKERAANKRRVIFNSRRRMLRP